MHIECHLTMRICQNPWGSQAIVQRLPTILENAQYTNFYAHPSQSKINKSTVNRENITTQSRS